MTTLDETPLGKPVDYSDHYDPGLLCPISREAGRADLGLTPGEALPFFGEDVWNAYELSWLDNTGKPEIAMMEIRVPVDSPFLVESKSLKLYLSSFNMSRFSSGDRVASIVKKDLSLATGHAVTVTLVAPEQFSDVEIREPPGGCLDLTAPRLVGYTLDAQGLKCADRVVSEAWFTRLFRSTCPVTGQPDWGTISIVYTGNKIDAAGLLGYLISFRQYAGFHENCVERIFMDITRRCRPEALTVSARFTRRGGLDINPVRSIGPVVVDNIRDPRQ
ncbi:MAG: NADPH-dependent 7-cyano-7-deazaguanine reductase QueF [Pseudomonadota bacterium]